MANEDLDVLDRALDSCLETPVSCLDPTELSERLERLVAISAKLAAVRIKAVAAGTAADVGVLSDQRNTSNHVAGRTNADPAAIRFDERLAKWLIDMPVVAEALADGLITVDHVEQLRLADNERVHLQMIASQAMFVRWFETVLFRDVKPLLEEWLLGADPDGAEPKDHLPETGVTVTTIYGGMVKVVAILDPVQGAAFKGDLNAETRRLRAQEKEADEAATPESESRSESKGKPETKTEPKTPPKPKMTVRRRNLVALLNLMGRGAARPDGGFARPRVNIVMSQRVYEKTLAWLEDPSANDFPKIDRSDIDSKCQLMDGTPIHPLYGLAATATAKFRRTVYSARGRPIEASLDTRSIPDWMREIALITSNGKCANPVCDAPFAWLHGDHITPYSHTQDTSVINTRGLCEPDNQWRGNDMSRGRWRLPEPDVPIAKRAEEYDDEMYSAARARSRLYELIAKQSAEKSATRSKEDTER